MAGIGIRLADQFKIMADEKNKSDKNHERFIELFCHIMKIAKARAALGIYHVIFLHDDLKDKKLFEQLECSLKDQKFTISGCPNRKLNPYIKVSWGED